MSKEMAQAGGQESWNRCGRELDEGRPSQEWGGKWGERRGAGRNFLKDAWKNYKAILGRKSRKKGGVVAVFK